MTTAPKATSPGDRPSGRASQDPIAEWTARLLTALLDHNVVFLARSEVTALAVANALRAGAPDAAVIFCPAKDSIPGEAVPSSAPNVGQRTSALRELRMANSAEDRRRIALISTGEAAARLYPPPEAFDDAPPVVAVGDELPLADFGARLEEIGYHADDRVDEPGEVAVRGQVLDVYPADAGMPYRIEIQDDVVRSIHPYDPATQLTSGDCDELQLGRATEPELNGGVPLLAHLEGARLVLEPGADARRQSLLKIAADSARRKPERAARDICSDEQWKAVAAACETIGDDEAEYDPPPRFVEMADPVRAFARHARAALDGGEKVLLLGSRRDLRFLNRRVKKALGRKPADVSSWREVLQANAGEVLALAMPLPEGFRRSGVFAVSSTDLLGSRAGREGDSAPVETGLFQTVDIRTGDLVVHEDHGLCVVEGLEVLPSGEEAIVLRFANDNRRLVHAAEASRIWRYGAEESGVRLDGLDGTSWEKRRGELEAELATTARQLLSLAAERETKTAPVLDPDSAEYEKFVAGFPFTETADQARATGAVRHDLASGKPMDRLVVGDVGYGKTEVALRAAALAALSGKQVALAAPTTVLVRQHLETFRRRFEDTGVEVAGLSRLSSAAEKKRVKAGLADGSIRVVIGTGAVAGKGVEYADLALVIVDEEQRFGTADKNKLRGLGAGHVLSLSATPIPRTLQNALVGLQQLSVIATPPSRRQPIRTLVTEFDEQAVRSSLLRERSRGGQSFVVVPRIEDIPDLAERLHKLVPELEVLQAHGKMPAGEIDETMVRFADGEGDVLLATNIIEAGLDVPRANTMIVWHADRFGLAQLHQLRGRVGRAARRGHVVLTTEPGSEIAPKTMARLNTLSAFDRLGAGFAISARDLDIRGAGSLLGEEQAGHVKLIGVELYQQLLDRAVRHARGEPVDEWLPTINLGIEGLLPETWIPEADLRIGLYIRLARIADLASLEAFEEELADRFGAFPPEAECLVRAARLRVLARASGVERVDAGPSAIALRPRAGSEETIRSDGFEEKDGRFLLRGDFEELPDRLDRTEELLSGLSA